MTPQDVIRKMADAFYASKIEIGGGAAWSVPAGIRAALRALNEAGYVVVPVEPTDEMMIGGDAYDVGELTQRGIWEEMLRASPSIDEV